MANRFIRDVADAILFLVFIMSAALVIVTVISIHEFLVANTSAIYILIVVCIGMAVVLLRYALQYSSGAPAKPAARPDALKWDHPSFYAHQLAVINETRRIEPTNLLNKEEAKPFYGARDALFELLPETRGWNVYAQASMGEFLECSYKKARRTFNSKRVDLLICDNYGMPVLVIEHQGSGHINPHNSTCDEARNQVKHAVLKKAGIRMIETPANVSSSEAKHAILGELRTILKLPAPVPLDESVVPTANPMAVFAKNGPTAA